MAGVDKFRARFAADRPEPTAEVEPALPPVEPTSVVGALGAAIIATASGLSPATSFSARAGVDLGVEILTSVYLENTRSGHNKFWTLRVEKSADAGYTLRRRWGRIGTRGQEKVEGFGSRRTDAMSNFYALRDSKLRDGYLVKEFGTR